MKTKTIIIILVIVLVLAAGVWFFAKKQTDTTTTTGTSGTGAGTGGTGSGTAKVTEPEKMPLVQGSTGTLVKDIQTALNSKYKAGLTVDGIWGPKTQAALSGNNLATTIYWQEWSEITGLALNVNGTAVSQSTRFPGGVFNPLNW